ncbi:MAG TPA: metalloregulator ArsR/SmtB family transcription factor [Gemmatimonadaceae bacterium]|nr:metalloregulator ArsR/SmtB family transcription factor [Gemmatimonadaceae bacterium]
MTTTQATDLTRAARLFHALSDETRLGILEMLRDGEQCVCDLTDALDAAQSRLSFHLRVLKDAGLVTDRKEGRWSFYEIDPAALDELGELVAAMRPGLVQIARGNGRSAPGARTKAAQALTRGCCR